MNKQEAVDQSIKKWEEIAKYGASLTPCGLCGYFEPQRDSYACRDCPLYPDICSQSLLGEETTPPLFWLYGKLDHPITAEAHPDLVQAMINFIKLRGQAWVNQDNKEAEVGLHVHLWNDVTATAYFEVMQDYGGWCIRMYHELTLIGVISPWGPMDMSKVPGNYKITSQSDSLRADEHHASFQLLKRQDNE